MQVAHHAVMVGVKIVLHVILKITKYTQEHAYLNDPVTLSPILRMFVRLAMSVAQRVETLGVKTVLHALQAMLWIRMIYAHYVIILAQLAATPGHKTELHVLLVT